MASDFAYRLAIAAVLALLGGCGTMTPAEPAGASILYPGLDEGDLAIMTANLQDTLESVPSGSTTRWSNYATGRSGALRPVRTFRNTAAYYCRNFEESIASGGVIISRLQTACRTRNGIWVIALAPDLQP
jgi:surface antigen